MRVAVWLSLCVVAAFAWAASAVASGSLPEGLGESVGGVAAGPRMSLESPFLKGAVPTPEQLRGDVVSRTAFKGLDREAAVSLAKRDFGISRPSWVSPQSEGGGRVTRYLGENAAAELLPGGQHAVLTATLPLRANDGSGLAPVSLTLRDDGEAYVPVNPLVPVAISTQAAGGVAFGDGLSVAPVTAAAGSAPTVVGNRVVFANTARDMDLIEEPLPGGAAISWQLRSQESSSSQALAFRLPPGGSLRESTTSAGAVEVLAGGKPKLLVRPAVAYDAHGAPVPVSYTIAGNVLTTHVDLSGNIAFPVFIDPVIEGVALFEADYGEYAGEGRWSDWGTSIGSGWGLIDEPAKFGTSASPGVPLGSVAEFYVAAPGPQGKPGSAGISRVNLEGLTHSTEESKVQAAITGDSATEPVYSFVPTNRADTQPGTMDYVGDLSGALAAFCAHWTGYSDSEPEGLCDEQHNQGSRFYIAGISEGNPTKASQFLWFDEAVFVYREPAPPKLPVLNHPGYNEQWLKTAPSNFTIEAEDEGLGIGKLELDAPGGTVFTEENSCEDHAGFAGCPSQYTSGPINLAPIAESGEIPLTPVATSPGEWVQPGYSFPLYLDQSEPVIAAFTGSLAQAENHVIGDGNYTLGFSATDGSGENAKTVRSGVRSIEVKVDGKTVDNDVAACPEPLGPPLPNCYGLSGSWTMNGQTYGAGVHTITVVAKNWVGTTSEKSFNVTVNEAAYEPVGPGAVNLETGDFKLNPTDVSISGGNASLTVSRTYDSRNLTQGATGPLGPQWVLNLPDSAAAGEWQSLSPLTNGSVVLSTANGKQVTFTPKEGGGYNSPAGYQNETLTEPSHNPAEYELTDPQSDYTRFTQPSSGAPFVPSKVAQTTTAGVGGLNKVTYLFTTKEGITEPTEVLAPEPSEGACTPKLVQGCRALTFEYATNTTASGEAEKEWGEYKGRLSKVYFTAWESAKGEMSPPIAVAQYAFDSKGHLRAEWDPRLAKPLVTTDGYDSEGHVTAVSPPGQEPWLLHYGTIASDPNTGRLLSVARFNAEPALWNGKVLKSSKAPKLSTSSPVLGTALSTTAGTWNEPVANGYQWERCGYAGEECAPIDGATNESYTPIVADVGHALRVQVTGTGTAGSVAVTSEASAAVNAPLGSPFSFGSRGTGAGQTEGPEAVAIAPSGDVWIADTEHARLEEFSASGAFIEALGWGVANGESKLETCTTKCESGRAGYEWGQFYRPDGIAINQRNGDMYVSDWKANRVQEFSATGEFIQQLEPEGHSGMGEPMGVAVDAAGNVWVASNTGCDVWKLSSIGALEARYGECGKEALGKFEEISGVAVSGEALYATDDLVARIQELLGGNWVREFGSSGKGKVGNSYQGASGIAADGFSGNVAASNPLRGTVDIFTPEGKFVEEIGGTGKGTGEIEGPLGLAANPTTGSIYVADHGNYRIDAWTPASGPTQEPIQPPPSPGTTSVTTIDYQIPVSGAGAPHALGSKEVGEWAQKEVPVEGTAIFPASEPQGWPATEYKRATIFYLDRANRTVNTVSPSGAITTTEYNEANDNVEHTLSPDNRVAALKEGSKAAEAAKLLQTESTYNPEGTELTSTLGPQHKIKLASGSEVEARKHTQYFYEEGAPGGGPYHLLTKTIEGAQITGQEEQEKRTIKTFYNGQENLGWKLHAPTSIETTSSSGHTIESRTTYEGSTGNVTTTTTPGDKDNRTPQFHAEWSKYGSEVGQVNLPSAIAVDTTASEDVWVADTGNNRIEEFSPSGSFIETFGWGVSDGKEVLETCKSSCQGGKSGTGKGQLSAPEGITYNPANGDIYVSDTRNNRIEVYTTAGAYVRTFGEAGSGEGKLKVPEGLTAESNGNVFVADEENYRIEEFNSEGKYIASLSHSGYDALFGVTVCNGKVYATAVAQSTVLEFEPSGTYVGSFGAGESSNLYGIACDPVNNELYVTIGGQARTRIFGGGGEPIGEFGSYGAGQGQFEAPRGVAINKAGATYIVDPLTYRVEEWTPGNPGAHTTETIYYTTGANASFPNCGKRPEWAGLPCLGRHAAQPEATGIYNLPETTYTYNIWNEPLTTTDTVVSGTEKIERTTNITYDAAGRPEKIAITSSVDKAVSTVANTYNTETGMLYKQSTGTGTETKSITSEFNKLGQLTAYTDAGEATTSFEYENEKEDRLLKTSDPKGSQTLGYEANTGLVSSVKDSAAGTFTATRDVEGNLTSEGYPNGMNAEYTYNPLDEPISLEYVKTTHCTSGCKWYTDNVSPSIHGQWLTQTSSLSKENYGHDELGRLTEAQETPAGKDCTARLYTDDEDGNRLSLTTRESSSEKCPTEGGTSQDYSYDTADHLDEAGVSYEPFGNITSLPAADAGGGTLTSTYYVNDRLASQEQNGEKLSYNLDPDNRPLDTIATGKTESSTTSHYDGPGETPAWTATSAGSYTRNITGINGALAATQTNSEAPVLQLADLHGDIIGTAAISETESKLVPANETSEYGVPRTSITAKYSWLGSDLLATELPTGIISMGARTYIPQLGRFLQTDPQPGGSANAYAYTGGDPIDEADPSGETTTTTYNYGAAEAGTAPEGPPQAYIAPGALIPPEVNLQLEAAANANPPWDAASASTEAPEVVAEYLQPASGNEGGGRYGGGDMRGFITDPDDHSPNVESQCNKTGQDCPGTRGGGKSSGHGHVTVRDVGCTIVGAIGGAVLDVPGALIAGGACIVIWP